MRVLTITILAVLGSSCVFGQYNDERSGFNAPRSIERGFSPLKSYFEKDSRPSSTYQNPNYGQQNPNGYGGDYQIQNQPPQYIIMPQPQALTAEQPRYNQPQVPDAISNYLATVAQKYGQGPQGPQDSRQGPQVFIPNQMAQQSVFQAPEQYQFVPPEPQYQVQNPQHQQPPAQFNQPEFANIQPAVPPQQQYPNNQPQYPHEQQQQQQQQPIQYQGPSNYPQLPPITKNSNDLAGSEIFAENNQNQNRPPPTKYVKGNHLVGQNAYSDFNDFGTSGFEEGGFGNGFGGFGGYNFGRFENSFDDLPTAALNSFKFGSAKSKGIIKSSNGSGGPSLKKNHRFSRGSFTGSRRPTHFVLSSS